MICTPHQTSFGDQIRENEICGTCSTYWGQEKFVQGFGGETKQKETTLEDIGLIGRYY
jgi:hypothetical protein